jgi:mannose-1-phosphate guanylyltransferase
MSRWAAVLAGGSGTRFWPLSTPERPKQLLPLVGEAPLLQQTVARLEGVIAPERILVVTAANLVPATRALLEHLPIDNILAEPQAASTGPALAWATAVAAGRDADASILSLHADWVVGDDDAFRAAAKSALDVAEQHDVLVTVGVVPSRAETGYGYIVPGDVLAGAARRVVRFTEKPDADTAAALLEEGALWNSGLFAWTAARFAAETDAVAPEIAGSMAFLGRDDVDGYFAHVTPIAVDVSHFERSGRVAVVPGDFPWDDVGTWAALARVLPTDEHGNAFKGRVAQHDASGCVAWVDEDMLVLDGVSDLVVVRANGVVLVTTRDRAAHLKELLASLSIDPRTPLP